MKYKNEILPSAWEVFKKIQDYYSIQFNLRTETKVSDRILNTIERPEDFPNSGTMTPDTWLNEQSCRMIISKKHAAIYRKMEDTIYIYHIADTQTEYTRHLHNKNRGVTIFSVGRGTAVP